MTSEAVSFLTKPYDELHVNREIEQIYKSSGLGKPKILVFDTIPACKFAYRLLLTHINNNSGNLTDEHGKVKFFSNVQSERDIKISILNIIKIIEKYYDNGQNGFKALPEIKAQLLRGEIPKDVDIDLWNKTPDETKNDLIDKIWNKVIRSKANFFEFKPENYMAYIFCDGILLGIFLKNYCILCRNPKKILENKPEELHSTDGYAIEFNDGNGIYFVHGIQFEPKLYSKLFIKKDITGKEILKIDNLEQVKIAIQYFGYNNLIKELTTKDIVNVKYSDIMKNLILSYGQDKFIDKVTGKELLKIKDFNLMKTELELFGYERLNKEIEIKDIIKIKYIDIVRNLLQLCDREKFIKEITGQEILKIENVEIRAILIQFFGYDNLVKELNAKMIDCKDEFSNLDNLPITNELWEFEMDIERRTRGSTKMKFRFVKVEDYSTHKKVCLGVPVSEQTNDVVGAIAWTFGMTKEEYNPQVQT